MIQLDPNAAAGIADRHRVIDPSVGDPQVIEHAQGASCEVPELWMAPLGFEFHHDDERDDHVVLVEAHEGARIGEQDGRVEHVGASLVTGSERILHVASPGATAGGARNGCERRAAALPPHHARTCGQRSSGDTPHLDMDGG